MFLVDKICVSLVPEYGFSVGGQFNAISLMIETHTQGKVLRTKRVIEENDFESRFDAYCRASIHELKAEIRKLRPDDAI